MPNLMTPFCGRGFVVHSTKKPWTKPEIRVFENPEEAAAYSRYKATGAEKEIVEELLERFRGSREKSQPPTLRKSARR